MKKFALIIALVAALGLVTSVFTTDASAFFFRGGLFGGAKTASYCAPVYCGPYWCAPYYAPVCGVPVKAKGKGKAKAAPAKKKAK